MRTASQRPSVRIKARFSFFAVLGFILCTDSEGTALMCLSACILHELGHIAAMAAAKRPPESITFYGGGIHISGGGTDILSVAGGCLTNLILFCCFYFFPGAGYKAKLFAVINLLLLVFNLLPLGELDGKLILDKALLHAFSPERAMKLSSYAERLMLLFVLPAAVLLVFSGYLNFSALIFLFYLIALDFLERL